MKKLIGWSIVSSIGIGLIVWVASNVFSFSYGEWSFFIGLGLSVVLFFLNSSGGMFSKGTTFEASEAMWKIQKDIEQKTNVGAVFYGSVLFTIISFIMMMIMYF
ncbi:hypothetical protein [Rossellomorea sp. BNER]|uniref:hypothetical protein n=1 Tax=Rossellomorea sp. BNER TaxID=2962031 RepID=UPI003AF23781|nr:hypothetical protein [Rossellomorea sp. BNER]